MQYYPKWYYTRPAVGVLARKEVGFELASKMKYVAGLEGIFFCYFGFNIAHPINIVSPDP